MEAAVAAATMNPAKSIGIYDEVGSLTPGKRADVLVLDEKMNLKKVL
jgi:N-acetylglucosamine-6-phosphate deacetylase